MQDAKEEVRARLNIEDVIGEYVQLKRAGRNFKGLSPFSGEKTASFFVSPDKHIWHDFSSNKGGDVFSFVMEVEGMDFRAALEHLARKAGVDLSMYQNSGSRELAARKKRLIEANTLAAQYFQKSLSVNPTAKEYVFKQRGLNEVIVKDFQIGYAPSSGDALVSFLKKRGFSTKEIADAGLANRFGGDLFRGRMTVALMDPSGQVIGFTARTLTDDDPKSPKYLNTPQTLLYDKSRHVFGLSQAKEAMRKNDQAVLVEGNLDVVSSHQAGVREVVATAGTALTEHHLRALHRLTGNVRLAFDGDKAGIAATERAITIASEIGVELTIISMPDSAKDPDELIKQDVALWHAAISDAMPAVDWILEQYSKREDIATAAGKRAFTTTGLAVVRRLSDAVVRDHYEQKIAAMTGSSIDAIRSKSISGNATIVPRLKKSATAIQPGEHDPYSHEDVLLALGLIDAASQDLFGTCDPAMFHGDERQKVAQFLKEQPGHALHDTPKALHEIDTYVKILLLKAETRYADWDAQHRYYEAAELLRRIITEHKKQQKTELQSALREAEETHDDALMQTLLQQINTLDKEITRGKK